MQCAYAVDFNITLEATIDETMSDLLGKSVVETLHAHLTEEYNLPPSKLSYRLGTFVEVLDTVFGVSSAKAIGCAIARDFYVKIGLRFVENENMKLQDYLEQAKTLAHHD